MYVVKFGSLYFNQQGAQDLDFWTAAQRRATRFPDTSLSLAILGPDVRYVRLTPARLTETEAFDSPF